jgi:hypothetical protein
MTASNRSALMEAKWAREGRPASAIAIRGIGARPLPQNLSGEDVQRDLDALLAEIEGR